ncbi:Biopolymer transport protein ExbD [Planctomycetes bacterium K23_9]|uniref:Biopolymer transport protein ExbD n=2 Tax=Stieleria marina TaxID=1930275 RepID=A0A517P2Z3_9BACT|nr:Biopolymer transport protein ExbD [Planctomycetes bacterium K23_9]
MTPMIDVVFLLIIFFLVSSHLARQENHLPLDLPVASTHGPQDPDRAALTISVDADAQMRVGGNVLEIADLKMVLAELQQREGSQAAVRIRTDRGVQYRYVEPVLREAVIAGITDATIAVREKQP